MKNLKLGTLFGVEVNAHWSVLLMALLVAFSLGGDINFAIKLFVGFSVAVMVLIVITIHEFGHILAAKHFNIKTNNVTLTLLGGCANMENVPEDPWKEFWITFWGPFTHILMLIPAVLLQKLFNNDQTSVGFAVIKLFITLNIGLFIFNLIPALPMDGGRILRAKLMLLYKNHKKATIHACYVSAACLIAMFVIGIVKFSQYPTLTLLSCFIGVVTLTEFIAAKNKPEPDPDSHLKTRSITWRF